MISNIASCDTKLAETYYIHPSAFMNALTYDARIYIVNPPEIPIHYK